jgi:hypothetical protein
MTNRSPALNRKPLNEPGFRNEESRRLKKSKLCFNITNMFFFGICIVLFVVGILYVTGFNYEYSFTRFSTTLMAGFFIAFSLVILALSIINVLFIQKEKHLLLLISSSIILLLFITLFGLGIWGASVANDEQSLKFEMQNDMIYTIRRFEERDVLRYETMKLNWLQTTFSCCGIQSSSDWRSYFLYGGQFFQSPQYNDQWNIKNNMPYMDNVPDSCCIYQRPNCGKNHYSMNQNMVINTRGCLNILYDKLIRDLLFVSGLSIGVSALGFLLWIIILILFFLHRRVDL